MLGYESERRLTSLIVAVGDGERDLEAARQRLCAIRDFATHSAFERIDRDCSGTISSIEFINFLRDNSVYHVAENEMYNLVCFFDSDGNRRLSHQEFIQMFLPCEDNLLRNVTLDRPSRRIARFEHLPRDIELAMVNVIEKEIDLQRKLEVLKRDLQVQYDYSPLAAFRSIDRYNSGLMTTVNTGAFLRQNGHHASEMELLAIVRRMDTDGDASINYNEFAEFMQPLAPLARATVIAEPVVVMRDSLPVRGSSPLRGSSPRRPSSPMRESIPMRSTVPVRSTVPMRASSPLRGSSPRRPSSPMRESIPVRSTVPMRASSPLRGSSPLRESSPRRTAYVVASQSRGRGPILPLYQEDELVNSLKELCNLEQEIENAKILLAQKSDFNIVDAFSIFDVPRYGAVDVQMLQAGLNSIAIFPTVDECLLILTRYDKSGDRRLSVSEFEKMFLAHDGYYASMVARRGSNYVPRVVRRDDVFMPYTRQEFQNMWRTHIRCENAAEQLRQRLASTPGFNAYEAFNSLDLNGDGSISTVELRRMIESRGYFVGQKELNQVIDKMDKDKNGRVSFAEFSDDLRTKSPVRR